MNIVKFYFDNNRNLLNKVYTGENESSIPQSSNDNWIYLYTDEEYIAVDINMRGVNNITLPVIHMIPGKDEDGNKCWKRQIPFAYTDFQMTNSTARLEVSFALYYYNSAGSLSYPMTVASSILVKRTVSGGTRTDGSYNGTDVENLWKALGGYAHDIEDLDNRKYDKTGGPINGDVNVKGVLTAESITPNKINGDVLFEGAITSDLEVRGNIRSTGITPGTINGNVEFTGAIGDINTGKITTPEIAAEKYDGGILNGDFVANGTISDAILKNAMVSNDVLTDTSPITKKDAQSIVEAAITTSEATADTKYVIKKTGSSEFDEAYVHAGNNVAFIPIGYPVINNGIVKRTSAGAVIVRDTPTIDTEAPSKKYVDNLVSNINTGGRVFDTEAAMRQWLSNPENTSQLRIGESLYIKALGSPDYWWDGSEAQILETKKVDLTGYLKSDELDAKLEEVKTFATNQAIEYSGREDVVSMTATESGGILTAALDPSMADFEFKNSTGYLFDIVYNAVPSDEAAFDTFRLKLIDKNGYYININNIFKGTASLTTTVGEMDQCRKDIAGGIRWRFYGHYSEYTDLGTTYRVVYTDTPVDIVPSDTAPSALGTAAAGTSREYARADHVHPKDDTKADKNSVVDLTNNQNVSGAKYFADGLYAGTSSSFVKYGDKIIKGDLEFTLPATSGTLALQGETGGGGDASIDDTNISTTTTYSSRKIEDTFLKAPEGSLNIENGRVNLTNNLNSVYSITNDEVVMELNGDGLRYHDNAKNLDVNITPYYGAIDQTVDPATIKVNGVGLARETDLNKKVSLRGDTMTGNLNAPAFTVDATTAATGDKALIDGAINFKYKNTNDEPWNAWLTVLPSGQLQFGSQGAIASEIGTVATQSWVENKGYLTEHQSLADYAKKTDIPSLAGYATTEYVDGKVAAVYKIKSSVATYADLPATGNSIGDVRNVVDTGMNYVWTESGWDGLGATVDHKDLATKEELNALQNKIETGGTDGSFKAKYAEYATSADTATKATQDASGNIITDTYATKTELTTATTFKTINGQNIVGSGNIDTDGEAIIFTASPDAVQGSLTDEELAKLKASESNYIYFNNEIYRLQDKGHVEGYLTYIHSGYENNESFIKSITITVNMKTWVLNTTMVASKEYVNSLIGAINDSLETRLGGN